MRLSELIALIRSDLYRYVGPPTPRRFLKAYVLAPGFRYGLYRRLTRYLSEKPLARPLYWLARLKLLGLEHRFGLQIPYTTEIGAGFYVGHFGQVVVSPQAVIGRNCNLSQGVTLGLSPRGARAGAPTLGDYVYVGPGAVVVGAVHVGDHAAIGANCVVTKDVPAHAVVAGVPGRVLSYEGSAGYILNTDY